MTEWKWKSTIKIIGERFPGWPILTNEEDSELVLLSEAEAKLELQDELNSNLMRQREQRIVELEAHKKELAGYVRMLLDKIKELKNQDTTLPKVPDERGGREANAVEQAPPRDGKRHHISFRPIRKETVRGEVNVDISSEMEAECSGTGSS